MLFCKFRIHRGHFCLKLVLHFLRYWLNSFLFPRELDPLRQSWSDLTFRQAHTIVRLVCDQSGLFPSVVVSGVVASDDAFHLPPSQVMIEGVSVYSDFAHEQLKEFVDGR